MKKQTFGLLLDQLIFQINLTVISLNKVVEIYKKNRKVMRQKQVTIYEPEDEFWLYLRFYAISLSNIAKLFHPTQFQEKDEEFKWREKSRKIFTEQFDSNDKRLFKKYSNIADKSLRNTLEHIDQRIDNLEINDKDSISLSLNRKIVPINLLDNTQNASLKVNGKVVEEKILHVSSLESFFYDPENVDNDVYSAFGSKLNMQDTFSELNKMKEKAIEVMNKYNSGKLDSLFD